MEYSVKHKTNHPPNPEDLRPFPHSYNILTILSNLKFWFNLDKKVYLIFNKSIYFHYSLYILEAQVREHIKKLKIENPEMDDFEEE